VLRSRTEVRDAVASNLRKITPDSLGQFELLLMDHRCLQALSDQTLNDETSITEKNVERLLDIMRRSTATQVREEYEQKLKEAEQQLDALRRELDSARTSTDAKSDDLKSE
jgi:hypothetical protein